MLRNCRFMLPISAMLCALAGGEAEAVQRAHVASYGLDANTVYNCDVVNPCRFFQAATTVVDPNGEVVVLDSAGYGAVTLTQSISLIAPAGVYAGISVFPGATGITIATAGINVGLRGITINGQGGDTGISMTAGASLSVENGVVANFPGPGIYVASTSKVSILDTTLRDNGFGIHLQGGAVGAISKTTISGSTNTGIYLYGGIGGTTTTATISDTTISDSYFDGIRAFSNVPNANVYAAVVRSTLSNNGYLGISVDANVASTVLLTLSESMVARSSIGLYANDSNAGVKLETLGNNTVRQNGTNTSGTIAAVPLL